MQLAKPKNRVDTMFRAFSDRTRLRILNLLRSGELCVCDLVRVIGSPQPKISRHLAYLRKAGLVTSRKDGLWMYYELAPAKSDFQRKLLECLTCCFTDVPELARDVKTLGKNAGAECGGRVQPPYNSSRSSCCD
jgi:ArsR family transcriptional regulator